MDEVADVGLKLDERPNEPQNANRDGQRHRQPDHEA